MASGRLCLSAFETEIELLRDLKVTNNYKLKFKNQFRLIWQSSLLVARSELPIRKTRMSHCVRDAILSALKSCA